MFVSTCFATWASPLKGASSLGRLPPPQTPRFLSGAQDPMVGWLPPPKPPVREVLGAPAPQQGDLGGGSPPE